jgi:signal peptide peptidase SppA
MLRFNQAQIAKRFSDTPVLLQPGSVNLLAALASAESAVKEMAYVTSQSDLGNGRPYRVAQGLAFIPVSGITVHRMDAHIEGWFTGYDFIQASFARAMQDPDVKAVILDISSPGGEVHGAFETADMIAQARGTKPIYAVVDGYAYSAGYALASAADKIFVAQTGGLGSVGVVTMHVDMSGALEQAGISVEYIYAGSHKVDGNPYQALSESARTSIKSRIEESYNVFVSTVATNRGMSPDAVRATEAAFFSGPAAKQVGFADAIMSPREAVLAILGELSGSRSTNAGGSKMEHEADNAQAPDTAAQAAAVTEDKKSERVRIAAITTSDEAKGREDLASHLAFETDMDAEAAKLVLAKAPKVAEQAAEANGAAAFNAAMLASGNPNVGGGDAAAGQGTDEVPAHKRILANYALATGSKH